MSHVPRRRVPRARIVAAAAVAVTALFGLLGSSAGARGTAHTAATPSCSSSQLVNWLDTSPNGTAGTIFYELQFTNLGATCTLRGYPGVSAVTSSGAQIGNPASRSGTAVKTVTIAPNKSASTMVGFAHTANFPAAKCKPVTAKGLRVIPPNQTTSVTIKRKFSACSSKSVTYLTVLPIK